MQIRLACRHLRRTATHIDLVRLRSAGDLPVSLATFVVAERGRRTPTGTVTFRSHRKRIGVVALDPAGTATIDVRRAGSRAITTRYSGDAHFAPSRGRLR